MCRLFGLTSGTVPTRVTFWLLDAPDSLEVQSRRNADGSGIGFFDAAGAPVLDKQPEPAFSDEEFVREAREAKSATFIAHVRWATAGGRTHVDTDMPAAARGQSIPEGWIVDSQGNLSTDPNQIKGGALLPLGGPSEGYKGYGLAVIGEILCGLLTGLGFGVEPSGRHNDGCFMIAIKVEAFRSLPIFKEEVADLARYLKETPPSAGSKGVLYPGEIEHRTEAERHREGIEIEDATWKKLVSLATELGVPEALYAA